MSKKSHKDVEDTKELLNLMHMDAVKNISLFSQFIMKTILSEESETTLKSKEVAEEFSGNKITTNLIESPNDNDINIVQTPISLDTDENASALPTKNFNLKHQDVRINKSNKDQKIENISNEVRILGKSNINKEIENLILKQEIKKLKEKINRTQRDSEENHKCFLL